MQRAVHEGVVIRRDGVSIEGHVLVVRVEDALFPIWVATSVRGSTPSISAAREGISRNRGN